MHKFNRRALAGLAAVTALAGGLSTQAAAPQTATAAASCGNWALPAELDVRQSNGWRVVAHSRKQYKFQAFAQDARGKIVMRGTVKLTRFDTSGTRPQIKFIATWNTGGVGNYVGRIDQEGFVSGTTTDKFSSRNNASWHHAGTLDCIG